MGHAYSLAVAEKRSSAAFPGCSRKRDFAKLNLHLTIFEQPGKKLLFQQRWVAYSSSLVFK
jgi:hypothetical protein